MFEFNNYLNKQVFITCTNFRVSGKLLEYINTEDSGRSDAELEVETQFGLRNFYASSVESIELLSSEHPTLTSHDMYPKSCSGTLGINELPFDAVICVTLKDGKSFVGDYVSWTSALDNEPDDESISIRVDGTLYEMFLDEIESVKEVGKY